MIKNLANTAMALVCTFALDYMVEHDFTPVEFIVVASLLAILYTTQDIAKHVRDGA